MIIYKLVVTAKIQKMNTSAHQVCPRIADCFGSYVGYFADDAVIASSFILEGKDENSCL